MEMINKIFDQLDTWRNLPSYQLERRADLFFSLYLTEALEEKIGKKMRGNLIPEFPVRKGAIGYQSNVNQSIKIDYVAMTDDASEVVYVELKTDNSSRNEQQDKNLKKTNGAGFNKLLQGVLDLLLGSRSRGKYFSLLDHLSMLGLVEIPDKVKDIMKGSGQKGIGNAVRSIAITSTVKKTRVIYVQPDGNGEDVVNFNEFREVVKRHMDPISVRFEKSLERWASEIAGGRRE